MSYFDIDIPLTNQYFFSNATSNDVTFTTTQSRILIGTTSNVNVPAALVINSNNVYVNNTLTVPYITSSNITTSNLNGAAVSACNLAASNMSVGSNITVPYITTSNVTTSNLNFTGQLQQNGVAYVGSQWTGTVGGPLYYGGTVNASNLTTPNLLLANGGIQIAGFSFVDTNRAISCGNINTNLGTLSCSTVTTNNYNVNAGSGTVTCGTIIQSTYYECWVKIMQISSTSGQVNFELTPSLVNVPSSTYITRKYTSWTNASYGDSWIPPVAGIWSISVTLNVQGTYAIMGIVKNPAFANSTDYTGASVNNVLSLTDMTTGEVMSNSVTTYLSTSDYIGIGIYGCTTFTATTGRCISSLHATLIQRTA